MNVFRRILKIAESDYFTFKSRHLHALGVPVDLGGDNVGASFPASPLQNAPKFHFGSHATVSLRQVEHVNTTVVRQLDHLFCLFLFHSASECHPCPCTSYEHHYNCQSYVTPDLKIRWKQRKFQTTSQLGKACVLIIFSVASFKLPIHRSGQALNGKIIPNSALFRRHVSTCHFTFQKQLFKSVVGNFVDKRVKSGEINACRPHYK